MQAHKIMNHNLHILLTTQSYFSGLLLGQAEGNQDVFFLYVVGVYNIKHKLTKQLLQWFINFQWFSIFPVFLRAPANSPQLYSG